MLETLVLFGATGDLTGRLLLPAVAGLRAAGALPPGFRVVGAGEQAWSTAEFREHARRRLAAHAPSLPAGDREGLVEVLQYRRADVTDAADVAAVLDGIGPCAVYLALPTQLMLPAARALVACSLPPGSRVAVEKPFGQDAAGAAALETALAGLDDVDRVDHALAMTGVQRLPSWLAEQDDAIEQVDLLWEETLALEGRAAFYDRAGALRDVLQNHLVQLLCAVAAEPGTSPARARAAVLRAVRPVDVRADTRRARYAAGRLADGTDVPDYVDEDGVDPARGTETFAEVALTLDLPAWIGTRFVLRAGKALGARRRGVLLRSGSPRWLDLDAEDPDGAEPAAYGRIVADLLTGGSAFAVGQEEVALAWAVCTPVLDAWAAGEVPMDTYRAGSSGPLDGTGGGEG